MSNSGRNVKNGNSFAVKCKMIWQIEADLNFLKQERMIAELTLIKQASYQGRV